MRALGMAVLMTLAEPVLAADEVWLPLNTAEIFAALTDRTLYFDAYTRQVFQPDGVTGYYTERFAEGRWTARDDQYCNRWRPSDRWECYDIEASDAGVRFVSGTGAISLGRYAP